MSEIVIGPDNYKNFQQAAYVDGELKARGLVPRNYFTHPAGCYAWAPTFQMPLIPRTEWPGRIRQLEAEGSNLSSIRLGGNAGAMIPSRDQNGKGYCWAHSSTSACLILRALMNEPYADLSAYMVACIIKNYRDEGGWGAESLDWIVQNGIASSKTWPQQSMSRSNDNAAMRAEAALHKVNCQWADLSQAEYDRKLTFDQTVTCLLSRCPVVTDFNWWSHSVCAIDAVMTSASDFRSPSGKQMMIHDLRQLNAIMDDTAGVGLRIWNSWGDSWSDRGMGVLKGQQAMPDGAIGAIGILASAA